MVVPRFLPRTLKGVGGVRLIDMPGVKYPESMLRAPKGTDKASGRPYTRPPSWGISSREAAELLGISVRATRALLNRNKTRYQLVQQESGGACMYWDKRVVERLRARRAPVVRKVPEKLCTALEACCILMVARSSLFRYMKSGLLKEIKVRQVTETGVRSVSYYVRSEVRLLAARKKAAKARAEQMRQKHFQNEWKEQSSRLEPASKARKQIER